MVRKTRSAANNHHGTQTSSSRLTTASREPAGDLIQHAKEYARARPEVVALACLGVGFVLGWKLKLW
jgi:hypothetical protein